VSDHQVFHVQAAPAALGVLFGIQEVRTIRREHGSDVRGNHPEPAAVSFRRHGREAALRVVFALRRVRRRSDDQVRLHATQQSVDDASVAAIATDKMVAGNAPDIARPSHRLRGRLGDLLFLGVSGSRGFGVRQEHAQLVVAEAESAEVNLGVPQFGQFGRERLPGAASGRPSTCRARR